MSKQLRPLLAFLSLAIVLLACVIPIPPVGQPQPTLSSGTATPPFLPVMWGRQLQ